MDNSCSICDERYDEKERTPLVLPCSHSFCKTCLLCLEQRNNKTCPHCRKPWSSVEVDSLLCCYQLIPANTADGNFSSQTPLCPQHNSSLSMWCESCDVPVCTKCVRELHRECQWLFGEEKCERLQEKCDGMLRKLRERNTALKSVAAIHQSDSAQMKRFVKKCNQVHESMKTYSKEIATCQEKLEKELSEVEQANLTKVSNVNILLDQYKAVKELEKSKMPEKPDDLLLQVVRSYQETEDDEAETFITNFRKNCTNSTSDETPESSEKIDRITDTLKALMSSDLEEKGTWMIENHKRALSAAYIITTTSIRPSVVIIKGSNWSQRNLAEFLKVLSLTLCDVHIQTIDNFWTPSNETTEITRSRIDELMNEGQRCRLLELWGHLDATALVKLPKTMTSVGLVLRTAHDMEAVNRLCDVAFLDASGYSRLWPNLAEIHLCIGPSFSPKLWNLTWRWLYKNGAAWKSGMTYLKSLGITLALHFPRAKQPHLKWMVAIISKITEQCEHITAVKKLFLPGTSLCPDAILGLVRDCQLQSCEVHLPTELTPEAEQDYILKRYKAHYCTVVWDLDTM